MMLTEIKMLGSEESTNSERSVAAAAEGITATVI